MEPNNDIKQQNIEKLSQNNEKMGNIEKMLSQIDPMQLSPIDALSTLIELKKLL